MSTPFYLTWLAAMDACLSISPALCEFVFRVLSGSYPEIRYSGVYNMDMRCVLLFVISIILMLPLGACIAVPVERYDEGTMSGERGALKKEYVPLTDLLPTGDTGQKNLEDFDKKWQQDIQKAGGEEGN